MKYQDDILINTNLPFCYQLAALRNDLRRNERLAGYRVCWKSREQMDEVEGVL